MTFAIRKGVKNTNMRYFPKLLFSSSCFVSNTFPTWWIVSHEMDPLAYVNSYLDGGELFAPGGRGRFAPCYSKPNMRLCIGLRKITHLQGAYCDERSLGEVADQTKKLRAWVSCLGRFLSRSLNNFFHPWAMQFVFLLNVEMLVGLSQSMRYNRNVSLFQIDWCQFGFN